MKSAPPSAPSRVTTAQSASAAAGGMGSTRLSRVPLVLIAVLLGCLLLPRVRENAGAFWSFAGVGGGMLVWLALLWLVASKRGRPLLVEGVPPVKQHLIQACVQAALLGYWGWYWRPIYDQLPLIFAQLAFIFALDALVAWSRGRVWRFASGPTPIVMSTNLFIWFRDDWFVLQFAMVAAGLLGKEFIKWQKEGRRTHIFNPSGFGLLVAAVALISSGMTEELTLAKPLATTIDSPPHIFLVLFCLGLVVQHFFAVTLMTFTAAVVMTVINIAWTEITGVYLFVSTNLPAAAFLGLHLLMTDPSTSPRTNLGRLLFGAGYGVGYVIAFQLLAMAGAPELYAKLFPVPILNMTVQVLDRLARSGWTGRLNGRWEHALPPSRMNHLHMAVWCAVFFVMLGTGYVQDPHPGNSIPFWKKALAEGKPEAGRKLVMVAGSQAVGADSAEAYNELGILTIERKIVANDELTALKSATEHFVHAAERGSLHACENIVAIDLFRGARRSEPELATAIQRVQQASQQGSARSCFLLGFAHEAGIGVAPDASRALALYRRAGPADLPSHKGIVRLALRADGGGVDLGGAVAGLERGATAGDPESCWLLAYLHAAGRGVTRDEAKAQQWRDRARELGWPPAVAAAQQPTLPPFVLPERRLMAPPWSTAFAL